MLVLKALKHIHSIEVAHRDIKPGNVLVNGDCTVRLCDFGLSRYLGARETADEKKMTGWRRSVPSKLTHAFCRVRGHSPLPFARAAVQQPAVRLQGRHLVSGLHSWRALSAPPSVSRRKRSAFRVVCCLVATFFRYFILTFVSQLCNSWK